MKVICPYCGSQAVLKDAFEIYRRPGLGNLYVCPTKACDAYIGVHEGTKRPKGSLANAALRKLRKQVYESLDALWRDGRDMDRAEVYAAAAEVFGLKEFNIGDMRDEQAEAYLARSGEIADEVRLVVQRSRLFRLSETSHSLLASLRYLYVDSQRQVHHVLSHSAYRGHAVSFQAAIDLGLVRKVKKRDSSKVYYALTPAGCSAICVPVH